MQFVIIDDGIKYVTNPLKMGLMGSEKKNEFSSIPISLNTHLNYRNTGKIFFFDFTYNREFVPRNDIIYQVFLNYSYLKKKKKKK